MLVVLRRARIIDPRVAIRHLMERIIRARGQLRLVAVDFSELENPRRRALVVLHFFRAGFILSLHAASPRETVPAVKHRPRIRCRQPWTTWLVALKKLQLAVIGIPVWRDAHDQLPHSRIHSIRAANCGSKSKKRNARFRISSKCNPDDIERNSHPARFFDTAPCAPFCSFAAQMSS